MRTYFNKLKNSSLYKELLNNFFLIAFYVLLVLISINNYFCFLFVLIYTVYLFKNSKVIFLLASIISLIACFHFLYLKLSYEYTESNFVRGKIINIEANKNGNKLILQDGNKKYLVYEYTDQLLNYGDLITVTGKSRSAEGARIKNGFDYKNYLENNQINSVILASDIVVENNSFHIGVIKFKFDMYLKKYFPKDSYAFLKAIIIGDSSLLDEEFNEAIIENGILHLFAISGLHIALFIALLTSVFKTFNFNDNISTLITSILLILYLIITNFSPSVIRASFMYYLNLLNKRLKLGFTTLDIVSIIFLILIIFNPYYYYNLGFCLSFLAATSIVLCGELFKKYNRYLQVLFLSFFVNLITLPLVININGKTNLLTPLINVVFIEIVSLIILPISFFVIIFPLFSTIYNYLIISFRQLTILFSKHCVLNVKVPFFSFKMGVCYYLIILFIIKTYYQKKLRYSLIALLFFILIIFTNNIYFQTKLEIHFLDLANGESTLIVDTRSKCYALIDTGDGTNNEVTKYLIKEGIKKLDFLIITHNHLDHNGEMENIINNIKVNNLVISAYDNNTNINSFNNINIKKTRAGDNFYCGKINFQVLHPDKSYSDTNDNSIVLYSKIGNKYFLFLGDATKNVEEELVKMNLEVDVIKIAHHGSSTSTSEILINNLRPRYAIIMAGRVEKFAFPHKPTIDTLNKYNVKTFRTDLDYSIIYKVENNVGTFYTLN